MSQVARPLSPFVTIYRWPLAMALSIIHRATGVALAVGTLALLAVLLGLASGPAGYLMVRGWVGSWFGLILLFGWSWALMFHMANGVRHLFWDAGAGFSIKQAKASGVAVVVASLLLTVLVWVCVVAQGGLK